LGVTAKPSIVRAKAPMRISFAGGGTDFAHWYNEHGGAVLSSTINWYAKVAIRARDDDQVRVRALHVGTAVEYHREDEPVYDGVLDLAKGVIARLGVDRGVDVLVESDAPAGGGLGGSSALTTALLGAVAEFNGSPLTSYELAELNYIVERVDLGIAGGQQDQYSTTFGGFNLIEFSADNVLVNPLRIDPATLNDLESHLLLCYTGQVRTDLHLIDKQVAHYEQGREETIQGMKRLQELAFTMKEQLLRGNLDDLGLALHDGYAAKKAMNPDLAEGTNADVLYAAARDHGATGGKLLGAGGGGFLLLYAPIERHAPIKRALTEKGGEFQRFSFEDAGLQVWRSRSE